MRRVKPDTRPGRDVSIYVPDPAYLEAIQGEQEFVDRLPPEIKQIAWDRGIRAARGAYTSWRAARVRGLKWDGSVELNHATLLGE